MKAEIIDVPRETYPPIVLFDTGLKFRDKKIFLESTGRQLLDTNSKKAIHRAFKLDEMNELIT